MAPIESDLSAGESSSGDDGSDSDEASDVPPEDDDISLSSDDIEPGDIDELLSEHVEECQASHYTSKQGHEWRSSPTHHGFIRDNPHDGEEDFAIGLTKPASQMESSYFSLFMDNQMLDR